MAIRISSAPRSPSRLLGPTLIALPVGLGVVGLCLAAMGSSREADAASAYWRQRQAAVDPLQLWSIEVTPEQPGWAPVRLCVDQALKAGFTRPLPYLAGQPCKPVGEPIREARRYDLRCELDGRMQGVSSTFMGDMARDFTVTYTVTDLDGFMFRRGGAESTYQQTRRYRRLGACPTGWVVGDQTRQAR